MYRKLQKKIGLISELGRKRIESTNCKQFHLKKNCKQYKKQKKKNISLVSLLHGPWPKTSFISSVIFSSPVSFSRNRDVVNNMQ